MQTRIVKEPKLLGKRSISSKQNIPLSLSEKSISIEIEDKIQKSKRKKSIFTKKKDYCTCSSEQKTCNKPIAPWLKNKRKKS
jgi:hypothetical protein